MKTGEEWLRSRVRAWGECYEPGTRFISNFHRLYLDGAHSSGFVETCLSMQEDLDYCRSLKIASSSKGLSNTELVDNFFTAGGLLDEDNGFCSKREKYAYVLFCEKLMQHHLPVRTAAEQVLSKKIVKKPKSTYYWYKKGE